MFLFLLWLHRVAIVQNLYEYTRLHEMLDVSGFSKYDTFTLEVRISWNAGNVGDLRIIYYNILSLMYFI
jgi:hypothetical protein